MGMIPAGIAASTIITRLSSWLTGNTLANSKNRAGNSISRNAHAAGVTRHENNCDGLLNDSNKVEPIAINPTGTAHAAAIEIVLSTTSGITSSSPNTLPAPATINATTGPLIMRFQPSRIDKPDNTTTPTVQIASSQPTLCTSKTPTLSGPNNPCINGIGM